MTGIGRGSGGPPWSVDLLADLQAGVLDPQQAADLRQQVDADPAAQEILAALAATQADLREFALAPAPPMPAQFAARLDAAIAAESQARAQSFVPPQQQREVQYAGAPGGAPPAQVVSLAEARKRRNRKMGIGAGILAVAAAAAAIAFVVVPGGGSGPSDVAQQPPGSAPPAQGPLNFKSDELGKDQLEATRGHNDYGPFADQQKRSACFEANNVSATADPLGGKQVTVDGKPGTLFVIASGAGQFRLLAVGQDCGPGNPSTLANKPGVR